MVKMIEYFTDEQLAQLNVKRTETIKDKVFISGRLPDLVIVDDVIDEHIMETFGDMEVIKTEYFPLKNPLKKEEDK